MNIGTHSKGNTQSSLERYINNKIETAKNFGLTYTSIIQGVIYPIATHSHVTNNGKENFEEKFGVIKHNATYSSNKPWFIGTHSFASKGITLSNSFNYSKHTSITYSSSIAHPTNGMIIGSNSKMSYINPTKGITYSVSNKSTFTYSSTSHNAIAFASHIAGITHSNAKFGFGVTASKNRFLAQPNNNTQKISAAPLVQFISEMVNNATKMIQTSNVTINGNIVTSMTYSLITGDVVRVGIGHYLNNSKQMAIVK